LEKPTNDGNWAKTVVVPFATAVARPLFMPTLTTLESEEYQTTSAPAPVTAPTESRLTAVKRTVSPIAVRVAVVGLISRLAKYGPVESPKTQPIGRRRKPIMSGNAERRFILAAYGLGV